ncbi:MAG: hypothetical protein ABFC24_11615 [Methanoregulaceae archaeon]
MLQNLIATLIAREGLVTTMRKESLFGLIGAIFGMCASLFLILSAGTPSENLTGVQVALFSALGLGGAGIVISQPRFGGWMMILSALFLIVTMPVSGSIAIPFSYLPAVICFGAAGWLVVRNSRQVSVQTEVSDDKMPESRKQDPW